MKENILKCLEGISKAKNLMEINDMLKLKTPEEYKELEAEVNNLVNDGIIHETKYHEFILMKYCSSLRSGKLDVNKAGNGFLVASGFEDVYIDKDNLNGAINGDYVVIDISSNHGKKEGKVIRILKRNLDNIVGEISIKNNKVTFIPDDDKLSIDITLTKESTKQCVDGHKVLIGIVKKLTNKKYIGRVVTIIGHKNDPGIDILSIAYRHGINPDFGPDVEEELKDIPSEVSLDELKGRTDLTNKMIFTIDGDDTKDIDDAISLEEKNGNYLLGVHIADVSHYVRPGTALYDQAYKRGTSSYLADTVIPMLPHQLSNGICSLNPNEIRLTESCVMEINNQGKVVNYDIFPSYIKSNKQMTYKNVNKVITDGVVPDGYEPFKETLIKMNELAKILRKEKISRGYINFDLDEAKVVQNEQGVAIDIIRRERGEGENLIEDFMIAANETIAHHIYNMDIPFIYRIHDVPNPEKIDDFKNLLKVMGYTLKTNTNNLTPITMQNILEELRDKKEYEILSDVLLRSMKKAIYSVNNIGHFGLGSKAYTHFTSPIRRFPDLTVHRLLRTYLFENDLSSSTIDFYQNYLVSVAEQSSEREVEADEAEREVLDMKMAEYMESYIGKTYKGMIDTVTNFGMFVILPNLVEGLVHISTLNGYYNYVPEMMSLVSQNNKKKYRLGDEVKVKVTGANKLTGQIDFEIVEGEDGDKK
jgi:ribonuclease R